MKKISFVVGAICIVAGFAYFIISKGPNSVAAKDEIQSQFAPSMQNFAKLAESASEENGSKLSPKEKQDLAFDIYLNNNETASNVQQFGKKIFGQGPAAEAAANFIALTLNIENSPEFEYQFKHFVDEVNRSPAVVLNALDKNHDEIANEVFFQQIS